MFTIESDKTINVTRGDIAFIEVSADANGENYKFQPGDVIKINVFAKKNCKNVVLEETVVVPTETETVEIFLSGEKTKIGESISKPKDYWYEIVLNPTTNPQTIVGYDDEGAKIFRLYPEGEVDGISTNPEDYGSYAHLKRFVKGKINLLSTLHGYSAYEIAVINGFKGTEEEWLASLKGDAYDITEEDYEGIGKYVSTDVIRDWLDEHPEATTTVQDGSLEYQKLKVGTLGFVTPQMFGAKGDGVADDTKAIQAALDSGVGEVYIPKGTYMINSVEYLKPGKYIIDGNEMVISEEYQYPTNNQGDIFACGLEIHSNTKLVMDKETILKVIPNGHAKYCVLRCEYEAENIEITGGQIIGDRAEHKEDMPLQDGNGNVLFDEDGNPRYAYGEHGMGIYLGGNKNVKISNCRISNCWGDGIIVTLNDKFDTPSRNILVDNVRIDNARRNGISLVGVVGFTLSNSVIDGTGSTVGKYDGTSPKSAIDIEPSPYEWNTNEDLLITNCRMSNSAAYGLVSAKTSDILSKNLTVENCIFERNAIGFYTNISNLILRDSVFRNNEDSGISLGAGENCIVSNCLSYENEIGLVITSHMKGVVEGCVFSNNRKKTNDGVSGSGLVVNGCNEGQLTIKNCICDNNELHGMKFYTTYGLGDNWYADYDTFYSASLPIIISECTCNNNVSSGIYLIRHCKTNVSNCVLCNNGAYGIWVHNLCDDTLVTGCYLEGNYVGNASGANLACYGNNNSRLTNNTIRLGITELAIAGIVVGYYSHTTENTFIADNDVRGFNTGKDIWQVQDTNTIFGKNIKGDGTYA